MSDIDRLRAAAVVLDDGGVHGQREWPEDDLCICGLDWDVRHRRDTADAALLRAVANTYPPCGCADKRFASCRWHNVVVQGHEVVVAAADLADTILGDTYKNPADEYPREDGWGFG